MLSERLRAEAPAIGKFIVFEGIEGVGKSTQLALAAGWLADQGFQVTATREPGGTPLGDKLRSLLLDHSCLQICADAELLLMFAARAQHIASVIRPELARGGIVLCDRFTDASFAYQGGGRFTALERIAALERLVHPDLKPDLVVILDAPPRVAMSRIESRERDRIEVLPLDFFERVRKVYLERASTDPARYLVVDATATVAQVQGKIIDGLANLCHR